VGVTTNDKNQIGVLGVSTPKTPDLRFTLKAERRGRCKGPAPWTMAAGLTWVCCCALLPLPIVLRRSLPRSSKPQASVAGEGVDGASKLSGHLFVVQGDVRRIRADAVLFPTRNVSDGKWFPNGPPKGAGGVAFDSFTPERRVQPLPGTAPSEPEIWLSWVWLADESEPPVEWFVSAAEQYLLEAYARVQQRKSSECPAATICERELPLLALPVLGTGSSGAKPKTGFLLAALVRMLSEFVASHAADVVLVTSTRRVHSAAQAVRRSLARDARWAPCWAILGTRLLRSADRLAALARSGQVTVASECVRVRLSASECV
jgi:hypothetical protein